MTPGVRPDPLWIPRTPHRTPSWDPSGGVRPRGPPPLRLLTLLEPSGALRSPPEPSDPRTPPERDRAAGPARRPSPTGPPLFPLGPLDPWAEGHGMDP